MTPGWNFVQAFLRKSILKYASNSLALHFHVYSTGGLNALKKQHASTLAI